MGCKVAAAPGPAVVRGRWPRWAALAGVLLLAGTVRAADDAVERTLAQMTLAQQAGQVFMTGVYGGRLSAGEAAFVQDLQPGAVALFPRNTQQPPAGVAALVNSLQETALAAGGLPLIIATDQEGWEVQRLTQGFTPLPDPLAYGAADAPTVQALGQAVGTELAAVGVTMNLAPVGDLTTRDDFFISYRVMNRRTWGSDPQRVGDLNAAYAAGLCAAGVAGVQKHFPGHGGAATDSHERLPRLDYSAAEAARQVQAFRAGVAGGIPAVMVGHVYYPALEPVPDRPATLSPALLGLLREEVGFDGVILSDAMDMGAIRQRYTPAEALLAFLHAGGDLFVTGPYMTLAEQRAARDALVAAVTAGELPRSRLEESVRRILRLKQACGARAGQPLHPAAAAERIAAAGTPAALTTLYLHAATLVQDTAGLLPLPPAEQVAIIFPLLRRGDMAAECRARLPAATYLGFTLEPPTWMYGQVAALGREKAALIIFTDNARRYPGQQRLVNAAPPEKTIVVALHNPYDLEAFPDISTYLTLYHSNPFSQAAACRLIAGAHPIRGRLPLAVGAFAAGTGLDRP
ncbi:MAG: hypothetical protein MUE40_20980 [Anaerolineae bacterium]|nr:hypothetical protein [Anaerolineae bacterium]